MKGGKWDNCDSIINKYIKKKKELEKEEQNETRVRRKEIKSRAEINKIENRKAIENINQTKSWCLRSRVRLLALVLGLVSRVFCLMSFF